MTNVIHRDTVKGYNITVYAIPEEDSPEGHFASGDDAADKEICDKIYNGDLTWFTAKVEIKVSGVELATEYLGACCYKDYKEFITDGYYDDMVTSAIEQADAKLVELCSAKVGAEND